MGTREPSPSKFICLRQPIKQLSVAITTANVNFSNVTQNNNLIRYNRLYENIDKLILLNRLQALFFSAYIFLLFLNWKLYLFYK
jgi:hypothetical protein